MKKMKYYAGLIVAIIAILVYVADAFLGIDIMGMIDPDTTSPVIDLASVKTKVMKDTTYDLTSFSCEDDRDDSCSVVVSGSVDTTTLGVQIITLKATDEAGNVTSEVLSVEVIEGLDTTMYVPTGYYDGIDGLSRETLKSLLNDIITGHTEFPYTSTQTDVWDLLRAADEDPNDSDNVLLFYTGMSWPKECQDTNTDLLPDYCFENNDREADYTEWNREHIWSKSHGDFEDEEDYEFEEKSGGYALGAHTDGHHLVAAERSMNSTKNNRFFDDCHDGVNDTDVVDRGYGNYTCGEWYFEPRDEVKGDVARMLFYMAVRYEGDDGDYIDLEITSDFDSIEDIADHIKNSKLPYYADLDVLLKWHLDDPVSEWELERNETIYQYQGNRNPFIDHPELVELIWGTEDNPINYISTTLD